MHLKLVVAREQPHVQSDLLHLIGHPITCGRDGPVND